MLKNLLRLKKVTKKLENPGGWEGPLQTLWNGNSRGVRGGLKLNDHPWEGYGYFLEAHIRHQVKVSLTSMLSKQF